MSVLMVPESLRSFLRGMHEIGSGELLMVVPAHLSARHVGVSRG
jgi:hypothetical protein